MVVLYVLDVPEFLAASGGGRTSFCVMGVNHRIGRRLPTNYDLARVEGAPAGLLRKPHSTPVASITFSATRLRPATLAA